MADEHGGHEAEPAHEPEHHDPVEMPEFHAPETHGHSGNGLESIIERTWSGVKQLPKAAYDLSKVGLAAGVAAAGGLLGDYFIGGKAFINGAVLAGGFIIGDYLKKAKNNIKQTYGSIIRQGIKGATIGSLLGIYYDHVVHKISSIVYRALSILPIFPPYVYTERALEHAFGGEKFTWKEANKDLVKATSYLGPFAMMNASIVPAAFNVPVAAGLGILYSYVVGAQKKEGKEAPQHGMPPGLMPQFG